LAAVIVDASDDDFTWIAASTKMAEMSEYCEPELIGKTFRLLDHGCVEDGESESQLRSSLNCGAPSTIFKVCRRKSGELFRACLNVRTLVLPYTSSLRIVTLLDITDTGSEELASSVSNLCKVSEAISVGEKSLGTDLHHLGKAH
jgi:hypothetical protein